MKLSEYKLAWETFNTDLGSIIGVGGVATADDVIEMIIVKTFLYLGKGNE